MTLPTFTNSGRVMFDYAITGLVDGVATAIPFLAGQSNDYPYLRESDKAQREQVDFSSEPGEQSLSGWWLRSQSSFHLGAGITYMDSASDQSLSKRFGDSCGINPFTKGQASLIRSSTIVHSTASSKALVSYSNGGEEGVLHANGTALTKIKSDGTTASVTWGGASTILALCTDGGNYYAVDSSGIYRGALPGGAGTKIYNFGGGITKATIGYAKDRLILTTNALVYELTNTAPGSPQSLPTALSSGPQNGWTWSAITDAPDAILMAGYAGDTSSIYAITLDPASAVPALLAPKNVQDLPKGEVVYTISSYMGTYIVVGTSLGVRVGQIGNEGRIDIGPLSLTSDLPVQAVAARGEYVWAGGSITPELGSNHSTLTNRYGLYKLSLSNQIPSTNSYQQTGQYAWCRDIYDPTTTAGSAATVAVATVGQTGRIAFAVNGVGVVMEDATALVPRGYLTTGRLRMDTLEDKIFAYLRVSNSVCDGTIKAQWEGEESGFTTLYSWDTDAIRRVDTDGSDGLAHVFLRYRFILTRGDLATTNTPVLTGYQARVQPSSVTMRLIRLVLQCSNRERTTTGQLVTRETWSRIKAIESAEERGAPVLFQDLCTGESTYALIEKCQFVEQIVPQFGVDRMNPSGLLLVTLKKIL